MDRVKEIIEQVRNKGLKAIKEFTSKFDQQMIDDFRVKLNHANTLDSKQKAALKLAIDRIRAFQLRSLNQPHQYEVSKGLEVHLKPLDSVGIYIPGGNAPLFSSALMTVIPAQVAGVKRIIVVSPPPVHNYIAASLEILGVQEVYQIGGAQAIAALAYGVPELSLSPVDKIVGPGNLFVTLAKKEVFGQVGIDALYGPSELMILADQNADPYQVACDLMSQLEHGSGLEAACLLTTAPELAQNVLIEFDSLLPKQARQTEIQKAWQNNGLIGLCENLSQACELVNLFAPEHLEIKLTDSRSILSKIHNAGAIFLNGSNEALGDYLAGPSHCLPTGRSARYSSGLSVWDFLKRVNVIDIEVTEELKMATALLAQMEGLDAHARSATA
ncbi:MAG: histidinol dehydrogenase [Candidatus Caenarcaniphilales bacterium]|nr:histidinol dehydrogenase [Candidatus Caenarcaniphilales bacterium]